MLPLKEEPLTREQEEENFLGHRLPLTLASFLSVLFSYMLSMYLEATNNKEINTTIHKESLHL